MAEQMKGKNGQEPDGYPEMNRTPFVAIQTPEGGVTAAARWQHVANQHAGRGQEDESCKPNRINGEVKSRSFHRSVVDDSSVRSCDNQRTDFAALGEQAP